MKQKTLEIWREFKGGKTAQDLVKEKKYGVNTIYRVWGLFKKYQALSQQIEDIILKSG
jgi:Mor family transcriptional regulator